MREGGSAAALAELGSGIAMAAEAEGAEVGEVALASAFRDGDDVVGLPEGHAEAAGGFPEIEKLEALCAAGVAETAAGGDGVDAAGSAEAAVAEEDLLAEIGGLGTELPLVDTIVRAEGEAAARDFERAPAAEAAAVGSAGDGLAVDPAAGHGARGAHVLFVIGQATRGEGEFGPGILNVNDGRGSAAQIADGGIRKKERRFRRRNGGGDLQGLGIHDRTNEAALLAAGTAPLGDGTPAPRAVLIFAHPDDETVALGARLGRLKGACFVHVTDGAPRNEQYSLAHGFANLADYREARRREFERVLAEARVSEARCERLEIPDQEASLCLTQLTRRIDLLLGELEAEVVFTHPYEGGHPDHDACAFAVRHAVERRRARGERAPLIVEGTFYHAEHGEMETGRFLPSGARAEIAYQLSPRDQERKRALLGCFRTQQETLQVFQLDCERFRVAPRYEFRRPPHEGPALYDRFKWAMTSQRFCELARQAEETLRAEAEAA